MTGTVRIGDRDPGGMRTGDGKVEFGRRFGMWHYSVSHSQLLLRSNKSVVHRTRIDVLFTEVSVVNFPTLIDDLVLEPAGGDVASAILERHATSIAWLPGQRVFLIRGRGTDGYVIASEFVYQEDDLEYGDPSSLPMIGFARSGALERSGG